MGRSVRLLLLGTILIAGAAHATCVDSHNLGADGPPGVSYVYAPGSCDGGYPCTPGPTSVSAAASGSFWALGAGDPAVGSGIDNGGWAAFDGEDGWVYFYPGYPAYINADWNGNAAIDGCVDDAVDSCMAVLLTDESSGVGYFALLTAEQDAEGDYAFDQGGSPVDLGPIPTTQIAGSAGTQTGVQLDLLVATPTSGVYADPLCNDALVGYRIWYQLLPPGSSPPGSRDSQDGWLLQDPSIATFGAVTTIEIACTFSSDLYMATSLLFDSGYETLVLSENSTRVQCKENGPFCPDLIDADGDASCDATVDCDASDGTVFPGAPQLCSDGLNNDCDATGWPSLAGTNESDDDTDGTTECEGDCADDDPTRNPDAIESCNGIDDDCNTLVDDDANGIDTDSDGLRNACDNCIFIANAVQTDIDDDFEGDPCDLDDGLILLTMDGLTAIDWQLESGFTDWNLRRGDLTLLLTNGTYTQLVGSNPIADRQCALGANFAADGFLPLPGEVAFYLASGDPGDGIGTDGDGAIRPNTDPCPGRLGPNAGGQ